MIYIKILDHNNIKIVLNIKKLTYFIIYINNNKFYFFDKGVLQVRKVLLSYIVLLSGVRL